MRGASIDPARKSWECPHDATRQSPPADVAAVGIIADEAVYFRYRYDGLNRRVSTLEPVMPELWTKKQYYYNENWQVLDEWVDWTDDSEAPSIPEWYASYVWDLRYIDSPITRKMGYPEHQVYYLNDANFNVTAVIDTRIAQADVSERYAYDPYGQVTVLHGARDINHTDTSALEWQPRTSNDYGTDVLFAGYRYDRVLNLYHVRHRVYHPALGRWMQRDPGPGFDDVRPTSVGRSGLNDQYADGLNLCQYVRSDPISAVDPSGLLSYEECVSECVFTAKPSRKAVIDACIRACDSGAGAGTLLRMPGFELVPGLSGSIAWYSPPLKMGVGVYVKVSGTEKRGTCCGADGRQRYYVKHSVTAEVGVHSGSSGSRRRLAAPLIESQKQCPQRREWQCTGVFKVGVRVGLATASCTWKYGSGWDCGLGIQLKLSDRESYRVTVGGGVVCDQTKVSDRPMR